MCVRNVILFIAKIEAKSGHRKLCEAHPRERGHECLVVNTCTIVDKNATNMNHKQGNYIKEMTSISLIKRVSSVHQDLESYKPQNYPPLCCIRSLNCCLFYAP